VEFTTADLCDGYPELVQVAQPEFREYGGLAKFSGAIETLSVFEDNALVRQILETAGGGRVLVIDGNGSLRCALVGGRLAGVAHANGWAGLVIYGSVRDTAELGQIPIGIRALNSAPLRSGKQGTGKRGTPVSFAGVAFIPGSFLYADGDGIIVAQRDLLA
jgi:regulator of ribonuclease activity A